VRSCQLAQLATVWPLSCYLLLQKTLRAGEIEAKELASKALHESERVSSHANSLMPFFSEESHSIIES
jgi:hypothetical protein